MKINMNLKLEAFFNRCRYNIENDYKYEFIDAHVTKATERELQEDLHDAGFAEFGEDESQWPSLFLSVAEWKNTPFHSHVSLDMVKNAHFSYETKKFPGKQLFNSDCIQKDPNRELNDWMKLRAMDKNFDAIVLYQGEDDWMVDAPSEAATNDVPAAKAHGKVITFGLGIGYFIYMALQNPAVESVTCVENSPYVIEMFERFLLPQFNSNKPIRIIQADAFDLFHEEYLSHYDYIYTDIWRSTKDGLEIIEKLLMQYNAPVEKADFWIEDSCLEIMWTLIFLYFDEIAHDRINEVNPYYEPQMNKIRKYFSYIDETINDEERIKFYMYDTQTIRNILSLS